ncbi:sulfatase [Paludibacter sp.]
MRKEYLIVPATVLALTACNPEKKENKRPNIIFMMTDDHTTQAMTCYGGTLIQTPNLDRIANEGVRFDNCYVTNALSGPSRACILTGKFSHVNGFKDNISDSFDGNQQTFPKLLQKAGYQTAMIGKWHLISEPQGFDFWSVLSGDHEQGTYYQPEFVENGKAIVEPGYVTDVITDKTIKFLENRDKTKPFMVMYHQKAPHRNWMPAQRHLGKFNDVVFKEPANLFDDYETRSRAAYEQDMSIEKTFKDRWDMKIATREELNDTTNKDKFYYAYHRMTDAEKDNWDKAYAPRIKEFREKKLKGKELVKWKYQQYMRDYLATTLAVDENVGRLLKYLEDIGELDNTIIVYTSDQGFFLGEHGWFDKRFMYEECMRMPFIVRYPKMIKAGSVSNVFAMNVDFAPTFLDVAGVDIPSDIQGKSLLPILKNEGKTPEKWRKAVYYQYYEYPGEHSVKRHYGIRTADYKLIHFYNDIDAWELYDERKDPFEMNNVYDDPTYKSVRDELVKTLRELQTEYKVQEI